MSAGQIEPGIDHSDLTGAVLRTKDELTKLLVEKQRALKRAQEISERLKKGEGEQTPCITGRKKQSDE